MTDAHTKAEKLANNAVLTMIARGAMALLALLFVPAVVALFSMSASVDRLASANTQLKTELGARIDAAEARINMRLSPLENRQSTQSDRLRDHDAAFASLTDKLSSLTTQVAVLVERNNALVERINALINLNSPQPPRTGGPR